MAEATETPVAQPESGNGSVPKETVGTEPKGVETQPGQGERFDFEAKVKSDPDFALEQVKSNQSRADRLQGEIDKWKRRVGGLEKLLVADGAGDEIAKWAQAALVLGQNPDYQDVVNAAASGQPIPKRKASTEEEDIYREPWEEKLEQFEGRLEQLSSQFTQQLGGLTKNIKRGEFQKHYQSVLDEFDFTEEEREQVLSATEEQIMGLAPESISRLNESSVRAIMLTHLDPATLRAASERRIRRELQERSQRATDVPTGEAAAQTAHTYTGTPQEIALQALRDVRSGKVRMGEGR